MVNKGKNTGGDKTAWQAVGFVSGIGIEIAVIIAIGVFAGKYLDNHFGISPWGTLGGIILGFMTGIWATYKKLLGKP